MSESPTDRLWKEYSLAFRDFDDLTLARWLAQTLGQLQGRVWRRTIESSQLAGYQRDLTVISNRLRGGQTVIHVLADSLPAAGFEPIEGGLEDLYFATLVQSRRAAAAA